MANCNDCINKTACAIYSKHLGDVMLHNGHCEGYCQKPQKPIIRHCKNCKWSTRRGYGDITSIDCSVRYRSYDNDEQRLRALLCKHYREKEGTNND